MRRELGDEYVTGLREIYGNRIPGQSDLCCYWFEKARDLIEHNMCKRTGFLATQGIRGGGNRHVLKRIKETGDIFFGISDRAWVLDGATVHVSMVGFDDGTDIQRTLNGQPEECIHSNLTAKADTTKARELHRNAGIAFIGTTKGGDFDIDETEALPLLSSCGNPNCRPNSDVLKPILNGQDVLRRGKQRWVIDNGDMTLEQAAAYERPHKIVTERVKPARDLNRDSWLRTNWWKLQRVRPEMREALGKVDRFLALPRVAKHRIAVWFHWPVITDDQTVVFARDDDLSFGIIQSAAHRIWAFAQGTQVRERESGFRYRPTTCFETFPFPFTDDFSEPLDNLEASLNAAKHYSHIVLHEKPPPVKPDEHREAISSAAEELNDLRERWLNPPEWTITKSLEFPGTLEGPWSRYIDKATVDPETNIGTVKYPRLEPKDAAAAVQLKNRTLTNLYNQRPAWLDLAHKKLDEAVAAAYGWRPDLTDEEILERLLKLNLERAAAEAPTPQKRKTQREKQEAELL